MTRKFASIRPETTLFDCSREFVRQKVTSILITEREKLLGIITQRDILWAITKKPGLDLKKVKAIEIATKKVAVIKPSADIIQAFKKMKKYGFRRLPVISKGKVMGILTIKDILAIEPSFYTESMDLFEIREEEKKLRAARSSSNIEGLCNECGAFSELLKFDGRYLCADCRDLLY